MPRRPALFLSHGAPSLLTGQSPARDFLIAYGQTTPAPAAYVVVSAHWESQPVSVTTSANPETVHDFRGFGEALQSFVWPAPGDPLRAASLVTRLRAAGLEARPDARPRTGSRRLDSPGPHRARRADACHPGLASGTQHPGCRKLDTGPRARPLAEDNIQLVFSGSLTHSLRDALSARRAPRLLLSPWRLQTGRARPWPLATGGR